MAFNPKMILADGLDGISRRRSRGRLRRVLLAVAVGVVAGAALNWSGPVLERLRLLPLPALRGPAVPAGSIGLFQRMSFLPQPVRVEAPGFRLSALDGQSHSLRQHQGKVVLLNFWATWCPPCIREMPAMQRLYERFRADGLEIVAISLDQGNPDAVREFVANLKLTFPVLLDPEHTTKEAYQVRALPTTYLVDREGKIVAYGMGSREWDDEKAGALVAYLLDERG